jgi:serine/threonine protein kinase
VLERKKKGYFKGEDGYMVAHTLLQDALKEVEMLKQVGHRNIIKLYEIIENRDTEKLYLSKLHS